MVPTTIPTFCFTNTVDRCLSSGDGSIDLTVTGGTTQYAYLWSSSSTAQDLINLSPGTYVVTVTDANSCQDTLSISITQPTQIIVTGSGTDPSSYGASDGSIDIIVNGGISPYVYNWSNSQTTQDITGLTAGIYCVTVTDSSGCIMTYCDTLINPAGIDESPLTMPSLAVVPNPVDPSSVIKVYVMESGTLVFSLFDGLCRSMGSKVVVVDSKSELEMPWQHLATNLQPGIYYLRLEHAGFIRTLKVAVK